MQRRFFGATVASMVDGTAHRRFGDIARKWRGLAEKRRDYFAELYRSGRWKIYYTEQEFVMRMREVTGVVDLWAEIAPPPAEDAWPQPAPFAGRARRNAA
jgi:uncharacterized repeat protein (TIGR03809 family)